MLELMIDLGADESCLDGPVPVRLGAIRSCGTVPDGPMDSFAPLFEAIFSHIPAPDTDPHGPLQLCVSTVDYNDFVGRIAIGRIARGRIEVGQEVAVVDYHNPAFQKKGRISALNSFEGTGRTPIQAAEAGEIVAVSGIEDIGIGNTLCHPASPEPLPLCPSGAHVAMTFMSTTRPSPAERVNLSPPGSLEPGSLRRRCATSPSRWRRGTPPNPLA